MHSAARWALLLLLGTGVLAAQEETPGEAAAAPPFWEARPFEEWTVEETLRLLTDSPWSRPATLVEPGVEVRLGKMRYYVQWYSAQTVREALVRLQHLKGRFDAQAEREFLEATQSAYQLYVFAAFFSEDKSFRVVPLEPFEAMTREELQEGAQLLFSFDGYAFRPDQVEFLRDRETQQLVGLRLTFERARRALPRGRALQGQVRIVCPTPCGSLSAAFLLRQMRRHGQPDL